MFVKPKLGQILISEGYIAQGELNQALAQDELNLGQVLVRSGRITMDQLNQALDRQ